MSQRVALEFTDPAGDPLTVEWDADILAGLDPAGDDQVPPWRLGGELDWDEITELRVVSAHLGGGRLLALAAIRPRAAQGHGESVTAGAIGDREAFTGLAQALISTEYGADDRPRRLGLELYREAGGLPLRVAGEATGHGESREGAVRRSSTAFAVRAGGDTGVAILDVLRRA